MELYLQKHYQMQGAKCPADVEGAGVRSKRAAALLVLPYSQAPDGSHSGMTATPPGPLPTAACIPCPTRPKRSICPGPGGVALGQVGPIYPRTSTTSGSQRLASTQVIWAGGLER